MAAKLLKKSLIVKGLLILILLLNTSLVYADIYRKPIPSLPITFDPKSYADAYSALVSGQIYDRLFEFDDLQNIKPNLAESWETTEGGKTWNISLKQQVYFHNGKPFTADDVAFSLYRLVQRDSKKSKEFSIIKGADEYTRGRAKSIPGIKIISPYQIKIELVSPFPPFLNLLASLNTEIIPKDFSGQDEVTFFKRPIGTGAFKFESMSVSKVVVTANDKYFGVKPMLEKVIFEKSNTKDAVEGFNHGYYHDLEWYFDVDLKQITIPHTVIKTPVPDVSVLAFNLRRAPLNNIHFRRAFTEALDKKRLIAECLPGRKLAVGYIPPGVGGYSTDIEALSYDLEKARQELKLSKLPASVISKPITILRPDNHICKEKFKTIIEDSLKQVGINAVVKYMVLGDIYRHYITPRNFDIFNLIFSADYPEALFLLNNFRSDHTDNYSGFKSKTYDDLLLRASQLTDRYERYNLYKKAQEILSQEAALLPMFYDTYESVYQPYVRGVKISPFVTYAVSMKNIYFGDSKNSQ